jgi:hypothetical protein
MEARIGRTSYLFLKDSACPTCEIVFQILDMRSRRKCVSAREACLASAPRNPISSHGFSYRYLLCAMSTGDSAMRAHPSGANDTPCQSLSLHLGDQFRVDENVAQLVGACTGISFLFVTVPMTQLMT